MWTKAVHCVVRQMDKIPSDGALFRPGGQWRVVYPSGKRTVPLYYNTAKDYAELFHGRVVHARYEKLEVCVPPPEVSREEKNERPADPEVTLEDLRGVAPGLTGGKASEVWVSEGRMLQDLALEFLHAGPSDLPSKTVQELVRFGRMVLERLPEPRGETKGGNG